MLGDPNHDDTHTRRTTSVRDFSPREIAVTIAIVAGVGLGVALLLTAFSVWVS